MKVQPYARVSTDDKGQDPKRQIPGFEAWCDREKVEMLPPIVEEKSASEDDPFTREGFVRACEVAVREGAVAVLLEEPDRLSRLDGDYFGWSKVEVARRYRLKVWFGCFALDQQDTGIAKVIGTWKAQAGHEENLKLRRRTKERMGQLKREEKREWGRPRKTLSVGELAFAREMQVRGWGERRIAYELSARRGAHLPSLEGKERRRRSVSPATLRRALQKSDRVKSGGVASA